MQSLVAFPSLYSYFCQPMEVCVTKIPRRLWVLLVQISVVRTSIASYQNGEPGLRFRPPCRISYGDGVGAWVAAEHPASSHSYCFSSILTSTALVRVFRYFNICNELCLGAYSFLRRAGTMVGPGQQFKNVSWGNTCCNVTGLEA